MKTYLVCINYLGDKTFDYIDAQNPSELRDKIAWPQGTDGFSRDTDGIHEIYAVEMRDVIEISVEDIDERIRQDVDLTQLNDLRTELDEITKRASTLRKLIKSLEKRLKIDESNND